MSKMSSNAETPGVTHHRPPDGHFFHHSVIVYAQRLLLPFIAFIPCAKPWQLRSTAITAHFIQGPPYSPSFLRHCLAGARVEQIA